MLGFVFAGSPTNLAAGVTIDGIDVGGMSAKDARALLERRSDAVANKPVVFLAGGKRYPDPPRRARGCSPTGSAAVDTAQRQGDGFGPLRGFKRLDVHVLRRRRDAADERPERRARVRARADRASDVESRAPRRRARPPRPSDRHSRPRRRAASSIAPRPRARSWRSSLRSTARPARSSCRCASSSRACRAAALATRCRARRAIALSAPVQLVLGPTRWRLSPREARPVCSSFRRTVARQLRSAAPLRTTGSAVSASASRSRRRTPTSPSTARTFTSSRRSPASSSTRSARARRDAASRAQAAARACASRRYRWRKRPRSSRRKRARRWTSTRSSPSYTTEFGGIPNRIHNVQLVAHLVDDKLIAPGATFSFNKTTGERNAAKGFLVAPVIVNGELTTGPRRRRLPGLDDRVQRGLRGRPEDHGAHEPRPLHQPLPAGSRRDRELSRRRSEVRERHGQLAAAAHVRQLVVADGRPLRHSRPAER